MECLVPAMTTEEIVQDCARLCDESKRRKTRGLQFRIEIKVSHNPETMFKKWIKTKQYFLAEGQTMLPYFHLTDIGYNFTTYHTFSKTHEWDGVTMGIEFRIRENSVFIDIRELWA